MNFFFLSFTKPKNGIVFTGDRENVLRLIESRRAPLAPQGERTVFLPVKSDRDFGVLKLGVRFFIGQGTHLYPGVQLLAGVYPAGRLVKLRQEIVVIERV